MKTDNRAALFIMLGREATKGIGESQSVVPQQSLLVSDTYDLALSMPDAVRRSHLASEAYRLFFVFEEYLRQLVVEVLAQEAEGKTWWDFAPPDVKEEVSKLEANEEVKSWMALGSRDKSALMTLPQLLRVIDVCWKQGFDELIRDKALIFQARVLAHLRNTICHMTTISVEETERVRQTMRDWFRAVAP